MTTFPRFTSLRTRLIFLILILLVSAASISVYTAVETYNHLAPDLGVEARSQMLTLQEQLLIRNLLLLGAVGAFSLAAAWWGSGRLVLQPVRALLAVTERLREGDLSIRATLTSGDEIAHLSEAFNILAAELEEQQAERQEAEAQLQDSERRYRRLIERSPDAILVCVGDAIAFINSAGVQLLGPAKPAQLVGQDIWRFIQPESQALARERFQVTGEAQPAVYTELKFQRLDQAMFEAEVSVSLLTYDGQAAAQLVIRDVTERKQSETALRESEELFRSMADNAPALIWVAGADGLRTFFNRPWLDFTGRRLEQERGAGWTDGLFGEDYQRYLDIYVAAFKTQQPFDIEYRLRRADGIYRWQVDSGVPSFGPDGQFTGFTGLSLDIAERHEAETALRLSRDQFAIILQGAADGITAQDSAGRLHFANDAAARMFAFPAADGLLAASWPDVLARFELFDEAGQVFPPDRLPGQLAMQGVSKASATLRLQLAAGGEERWLNIKATPVFDERDHVRLAISIYRDITEIKQASLAQRLLAEAGQLLVTPLDNVARLADVAQLAVPLLADWCSLDAVNGSGGLWRAAVAGTEAALAALPPGHPFDLDALRMAQQAAQTGESMLYPFIPDSLLQAAAGDDAQLQTLRALNLRSAMLTPLVARGHTLGVLTFVRVESQRRYGRADLALAEELGRQVALALDNARLYNEAQALNATLEERVSLRTTQLLAANTQLETQIAERQEAQRRLEESQSHLRRLSAHLQAAREAERIRIAREIHDELGQALAGLKMDVAWLRGGPGRLAANVSQKLEDMSTLIDTTVMAVRRISTELRPSILDDLGLEAALEWQLDEFRERTGLNCVLKPHLQISALDPERATALFRICQEALTNVARHANATQVQVQLEETAECLTLRIQDNGQGIRETDWRKPQSFGLLGMQERVHLLNGTLDIQGLPGRGTTVIVQIPSKKEGAHD